MILPLKKIDSDYYLIDYIYDVGDDIICIESDGASTPTRFGDIGKCVFTKRESSSPNVWAKILASTKKIEGVPLIRKEQIPEPKLVYRVGRNQGRAILFVDSGHELLVFPQGKEAHARDYCDYLNEKANGTLVNADRYSMSDIIDLVNKVPPDWYRCYTQKDKISHVLKFLKFKNKHADYYAEVEMDWKPLSEHCSECGTGGSYLKNPCDNTCKNHLPKVTDGYINILKYVEKK